MKKKSLLFAGFSLALLSALFFLDVFSTDSDRHTRQNDQIVNLHKENLLKSPYRETLKLSKKERKEQGLPPNRYYEDEFELTMNPVLGHPTFENLKQIREYMTSQSFARVPGETINTSWESRGPDNVAGRTRAVIFDRNDASDETVIAGGVSGGLWKNTQISNASSVWTRLNIPSNLNVTVLAQDPNNFDIIYAGTGESYVSGDVNGDGVWQSVDGGETWSQIFGGITGPTVFESSSVITINTPSSIAGDYVAVPTNNFGPNINSVITGDFVIANDATGEATEGCNTFGADASGKIALIRRGNCPFVEKVKNAQDAGAIAAIVLNDVDGTPINMGGTDASITIPAVMISKSDGDLIEATLASEAVNGSLNPATGNFTGNLVPGIQHINDIKIKDVGGTSEVYVAAGESIYGDANVATFLGGLEFGLYKSDDGGNSFVELTMPSTANGNKHEPNDIEIGADGKIWVATTRSSIYGDGGGMIFVSDNDGANFTTSYAVPGGIRTQIAVSSQDADKIYILAQIAGGVIMQKTADGFSTDATDMALPNDADNGIPAEDFTRGQAFYDLVLEVDPINDNVLYAGGIDIFRSLNGGISWPQISKWSNNNNLASLNIPLVHADQHAVTFSVNDPDKLLFGTDGGVYFSDNKGVSIDSRENGFVTAQFYTVGVAPTTAFSGEEYFIGGLQDNGTQLFQNAAPGLNSSSTAFGGDGAYSFFDQDGSDQYYITNFVFNRAVNLFNLETGTSVNINNETSNNGSFINPQALDSNLDILYSNYSSGGSSIVRRYSGIKSQTTLSKINLSDPLMVSRPTALTVSPFNTSSTTLLIGTLLGNILKVENANINPQWTNIELDNNIVGSISDVEFGSSEDEIFVTVHNYGVQNIWYTSDGGNSWLAKEGDLPDLPVKAILQNPLNTNEVIIGTELGVWFTSNFFDTSPNWQPAMNGMSNVRVTDMDLRDDNTVYVSTYGRGVFSGQFVLDDNGDNDGDGVINSLDNCINTSNPDQADSDNNGVGDVCQDTDGDGILDIDDNCPGASNVDQTDSDGDGIGDLCEDSDGDGISDVNDNCPDNANTNQEDLNNNGIGDICDTSYEDPSNIQLEVISEACENQDNGELTVTISETFVNYTVTLVGSGINMSQPINGTSLTISDLAVGAYTVCVEVNGRDFEQCFEINIDSAESLSGIFSQANDNSDPDSTTSQTSSVNVDITSGTPPFTARFNEEIIAVSSSRAFEVITNGNGLLEIESSKACEGVISQFIQVAVNRELSFYPNPVLDILKINLPQTELTNLPVRIYDMTGKLVYNQSMSVINTNQLDLSFTNLRSGVYFVQLELDKPETFKIIKK